MQAKGVMKTQQTQQAISLDDFLRLAVKRDTIFETILLDQLPLKYRRSALLPDKDILMSIKQGYQLNLFDGHDYGTSTISLSKLFTHSATEVSMDYNKPTFADGDRASLQVLISQPIAKNAFGKNDKLLDQIIGVENEVIRYQIVEAYEDYLAAITSAYYNWYSSYENLKVGKAALQSSKRLLNNILERQRQNIALPIDVNKMKLSLINKQENLILLQEAYANNTAIIMKSLQPEETQDQSPNTSYFPSKPKAPENNVDFDMDYAQFVKHSRTYQILDLLEKQGDLEVQQSADELLPSTNLTLGYQMNGQNWGDTAKEDSLFAGIEFSLPLGRSVARANTEIRRIQYRKTRLSNKNKQQELRVNLKNLFLQIQRERKLIDISRQKINLAESILKDESENYSYGKVTLNDYIVAVNTADENRFSHTAHKVQLYKLQVEWLRMTDRLVDESALQTEPPPKNH